MKAAARQILDDAELEALKTNGVERPYDASADIIPTTWTPEHAGKRIVEAFDTLSKLPKVRGPKEPGTAWPSYQYDKADENSQKTGRTPAELRELEKAKNRTVLYATGVEIERMDAVFDWLHDLHRADEGLCRVVQDWAVLKSSGRSIKEMCRDTGQSFQAYYRTRDKGVALIVAALNARPMPVF